jgi:hypothetical protein
MIGLPTSRLFTLMQSALPAVVAHSQSVTEASERTWRSRTV